MKLSEILRQLLILLGLLLALVFQIVSIKHVLGRKGLQKPQIPKRHGQGYTKASSRSSSQIQRKAPQGNKL